MKDGAARPRDTRRQELAGGAARGGRASAAVTEAPATSPPSAVGGPPWWLLAPAAAVTVGVTVDLLAGSFLNRIDLRVGAVVGGWDLRHGPGYPALWVLTQFGGRAFILGVLAVLVAWLGWRRRTMLPLARVLLAVVLLTAVVYGFKYGVGRTAPAYPGSYFHRGGASFPSGHVANAVLMWGIARWQAVEYRLPAWLQRLLAVVAFAGPVVAGAAMVALDFHWLTDAVVGAAVGILLLGVVRALDAALLSPWLGARAGRPPA